PARCQRGGVPPALRRFPKMKTLAHRPLLATRKFHQTAAIRARDSQRMDHLVFVETQKPSARHRGAEGSGQSGGVETAFFERISRSDADATHNFTGGHEGGQESFRSYFPRFAHSEGREECGCARVYASAGLTDIVQLKSMSHRSVG